MATSGVTREDVDFLSLLGDVNRHRLLARSTRAVYLAGTLALRPDDPPGAFLVEQGLVRLYWSVPDGRQATLAFIRADELIGGATLVSQRPRTFVQFVVDTTLRTLNLQTARNLAEREIEVSGAVAIHLAAQFRNALRLIAVRSLGDIRQRLAFDLLERACRSQVGVGRLEVTATHADFADSIGSAREVVSRALKGFRHAVIIESAPGVIRVVDPMRLAGVVDAFVI